MELHDSSGKALVKARRERKYHERLIKAGTPCIQLQTQYRMHPTISSIVNKTIYDGSLRDDASTVQRADTAKFQGFAVGLAKACKTADFPRASSAVISPVKDEKYHWGSQQAPGSTSRYNLQTAAMIFRLVHQLTQKAGSSPHDIMVIAFYKDQVGLLKALFADAAAVAVSTVDGSQGKERPVVIVDCVVVRSTAVELEFLASEKRRLNVVMSRAMVGRITICCRDFVPRDTRGRATETGVWFPFVDEALRNG
ncbi:MAG: hypothetical protein M1822_004974 [Bathelium mastoideum]|nr:MAG: hypothetical protein M1822_004974 [Bathelium mastoideum]